MANLIYAGNLIPNLDRITFSKKIEYIYDTLYSEDGTSVDGTFEREVLVFNENSLHGSWLTKAVFDWSETQRGNEPFISVRKTEFSFYKENVLDVLALLDTFGEPEQ